MDRFELRRYDFSLSEDQETVRDAFREFFAKESPSTAVRAAEPSGHNDKMWRQLVDMGVTTMGLPESAGGDGATLVDLVLVAEQLGAFVAPVPMVSQVVVARLLAAAGATEALAGVVSGEHPVALAAQPLSGRRQLVPDAALARGVVGLDGDDLVLLTYDEPPALAPNEGSTPLAWVDPSTGSRTVLASGAPAKALHEKALREWKILTAAALVALTESAMWLGVEFSKTRETMGVQTGTLQGVSFPLADIQIDVAGTRNMARKAAWYEENLPGEKPELAYLTFATAAKIATAGTQKAAHVQGGLGFTVEADASLFFLRAKGWSVLMGDPQRDYLTAGDLIAAQASAG
jgi:alkylation response protein AidB-like acyl-CoA dehydrogenase